MSLTQFVRDCVRERADGAGVGQELRYHHPFRRFLLRTFPAEFNVLGEGSFDQRRPDFRIYSVSENQDRDSPPDEAGLLGLIEAKGHSTNLLDLIRTDPRGQISSYLDISPNVLVTNFWEFRVVHRTENGLIETVPDGHYQIVPTEAEFWALVDQSEEENNRLFVELCDWFRNHVLNLEVGVDFSRASVVRHLMACYRMVHDSILFHDNYDAELRDFCLGVLRVSQHALGTTIQDGNYRSAATYLGQTVSMAMVLSRRINGPDILNRGATFLRGTQSRQIFSSIVEHREDLGIDFALERLECILAGCAINFDNFEHIESLFLELMRFGEDEFGTQELGLRPTPISVVRYMIAKANNTLRTSHDRFDNGLMSDDNRLGREASRAFILDPSCGTGRFYIEILRYIYEQTRRDRGLQAARRRLISAIGRPGEGAQRPAILGRVVAVDIQPACVLLTRLRLEDLLSELGIEAPVRPRIFTSDFLTGWDDEYLEGAMAGYNENSTLKRNEIHAIIGNPPWAADTTAGDFQNLENLQEITQEWFEYYTDEKRRRNQRPANRIDDPYLAFLRIILNKSLTNNAPLVTSLVIPDSIYHSQSFVGARRALISEYSCDFDLLGGQQRNDFDIWQRGDVFAVNSGSCILTFTQIEENTTRYRTINPGTATAKRNQLLAEAMDIDAVEYLPSRAHLDTWYDVTSGSLDDYPFIPINQICYSRMYTNGCEEIRKMAYFHLDRNALLQRCQTLFHADYNVARQNGATWRLWDISDEGTGLGFSANYFPRTVHAAVIENGGFREECIRNLTYRPMSNVYGYVDPGTDDLWNRSRRRGFLWGERNFITIPGTFSRRSHMAGFFHQHMPGNQNTGNLKSKSIPTMFNLSQTEINKMETPELRHVAVLYGINVEDIASRIRLRERMRENINQLVSYPNLSQQFIQWFYPNPEVEPTLNDLRQFSENTWYYVLAILSSPTMCAMPIGRAGLDSRIPFPESGAEGELFQNSVHLGRFISELQSIGEISGEENQSRHNLISQFYDGFEVEFTDGSAYPTPTNGWGQFERQGRILTPYRNTAIMENLSLSEFCETIDDGLLQELMTQWGIQSVDEFTNTLGSEMGIIQLNQNARIVNIPSSVLNFSIAGHNVISNWMAWRDQRVCGRRIELDDVLELRALIVNITCLILLIPEIEQNFTLILDAAREWIQD